VAVNKKCKGEMVCEGMMFIPSFLKVGINCLNVKEKELPRLNDHRLIFVHKMRLSNVK
jgi:hypothetical protein